MGDRFMVAGFFDLESIGLRYWKSFGQSQLSLTLGEKSESLAAKVFSQGHLSTG
jgi:hypothetical protein